MSDTGLLPCPFCGSGDTSPPQRSSMSLDMNPPLVITSPKCRRCGAVLARQYATGEESVAAWNRRASPEQPAPTGVAVTRTLSLPPIPEGARFVRVVTDGERAWWERLADASGRPDDQSAYVLWCRPEDFNLPQLVGIALSLEDANAWKAESEAESAKGRIAVAYFWTKSEVCRPTESRSGPRRL